MTGEPLPFEQFETLRSLHGVKHAFTLRVPGIEVSQDKATALARLDAVHQRVRSAVAMRDWPLVTAQQVHGANVAVVRPDTQTQCFDDCDGLITGAPGVCLGIYVADCCAIYFVDPVRRAIGLVHSGRRGTEQRIAAAAIEQMRSAFGSNPGNLVVQLSPCIRPPHYEVDFAAAIREQCREAGVLHLHDCATCTACDLARYYSYRAGKGRTGRMLALLGFSG